MVAEGAFVSKCHGLPDCQGCFCIDVNSDKFDGVDSMVDMTSKYFTPCPGVVEGPWPSDALAHQKL